jgi:4-amino-4-deoxy-L-arabinose transferase-like glycosyltransferase
MPRATIRPPFAWAGRYSAIISLAIVVLTGAFFRFYQLSSLPPGLHDSTARLALQAADLAERGWLPGLSAANGYAPLFVWLQALPIMLLGHTELALRLWPALLGTLAVVATWLWVRSWFGVRVAWLSAFLVAVTPWAVTLSRGDAPTAILPLLVTLTLWLATRAWRAPSTKNTLALVAVLALNLLSGPLGWLLAVTVLITGAVQLARNKQLLVINRGRALALGGLALAFGGFACLAVASLPALKSLPQTAGFTANIGTLGSNLVKTLLMFNAHGDENYLHNLSGEPLLNVFVGIMLIAGLLVSISRLHQRRYRLLLTFALVLLIPAVITTVGAPNAGRAVAALPLVLALAAIGISYLLELWYTTFPINSAARATGQAAIIMLLVLTAYQGYTQYFRAWASMSQVYAAHHEAAAAIAHNMTGDKFSGQRYVVTSAAEQPVVSFLGHKSAYQLIEPRELAGLPIAGSARLFYISVGSRDEAMKTIKIKFPGGILRPHYSTFNQAEIYYTYELTK